MKQKLYTVYEVRSTLGSIITDIFTPAYASKYHDFMERLNLSPEQCDQVLIDNSDEITILVGKLFFTTKYYPHNLDSLINSTPAHLLAGVFFRYDALTKHLMQLDPKETMSLPEDLQDFYLELLVNRWYSPCQQLSF